MKKILILLSIMGASQAVLVKAGSCDPESKGISLKNDTSLFLYVGIYNAASERCFDIIPMNPGQRIPDSERASRSIKIPKTGPFSSAKMYFSNKKADLKDSLNKDDIKNLEKKFTGFKVSSNNDYRIYPINTKGKPDARGDRYEGDSDSSSLEDKLYKSLSAQ